MTVTISALHMKSYKPCYKNCLRYHHQMFKMFKCEGGEKIFYELVCVNYEWVHVCVCVCVCVEEYNIISFHFIHPWFVVNFCIQCTWCNEIGKSFDMKKYFPYNVMWTGNDLILKFKRKLEWDGGKRKKFFLFLPE